ncbi:DUF1398 domain-containing protein [Radicibacter daui]|uniref:DUF1398 domain-containing protein n=1 Tax=Radicibacter daui TaxID=3064829 RepID=UPI004046896B
MNTHIPALPEAARAAIHACTTGSDEERLSFPEVIGQLRAAGVERYHADLMRNEKTYYLPDGTSLTLACHPLASPVARQFSAAGVEAAVRSVQAGLIKYRAFCTLIAEAGCAGYLVSLSGRRAVYYGRRAEMHVELFPPAP